MTTEQRAASDLVDPAERVRQLEAALETRTTIARAQGIIMERYEMGPGEAFAVLRRISSHTEVPLREVAAYLVETRSLPTARHHPDPDSATRG